MRLRRSGRARRTLRPPRLLRPPVRGRSRAGSLSWRLRRRAGTRRREPAGRPLHLEPPAVRRRGSLDPTDPAAAVGASTAGPARGSAGAIGSSFGDAAGREAAATYARQGEPAALASRAVVTRTTAASPMIPATVTAPATYRIRYRLRARTAADAIATCRGAGSATIGGSGVGGGGALSKKRSAILVRDAGVTNDGRERAIVFRMRMPVRQRPLESLSRRHGVHARSERGARPGLWGGTRKGIMRVERFSFRLGHRRARREK